ncbi:MAG: hypothetical protein Q7K03_00790 [Dehalococcoidia bacterium]|nr:hypothetical protein [Dehalococcoidia bacterium]
MSYQVHRPDHKRRLAALALGLAVLGLVACALFFTITEPVGVPFDAPERISYYRQAAMLLVSAVGLAISGLVTGRAALPSRLAYAALALGVVGIAAGGLLLLALVGLCGPTVLWGYCNP